MKKNDSDANENQHHKFIFAHIISPFLFDFFSSQDHPGVPNPTTVGYSEPEVQYQNSLMVAAKWCTIPVSRLSMDYLPLFRHAANCK